MKNRARSVVLGAESLWARVNPEALEFPEQSIPVKAEDPGRLGLIPLDPLENVEDVLLLEMVPRLPEAEPNPLDVLDRVPTQDGDVEGQLP